MYTKACHTKFSKDDYETCCLCLLGRLLFTLMREAAGFSKPTVHNYQTGWHHFPEERLSSESSHHPEFTNLNYIKNAVFWDVTPCNTMCTEISEHSAA